MDDLVQWLRDQLDDDQRWAERGVLRAEVPQDFDGLTREGMVNLPRLVKARVLREIETKRAIVDAYLPPGEDPHPGEPCINYEGQDPAEYSGHDGCWRHLEASKRLLHHDYVLRLLASVYADRPGFREEWRPSE